MTVSLPLYLILRVSLPTIFLECAAVVIWSDRHSGHDAVEPTRIITKLLFTFIAFAAVWHGDVLNSRHLRRRDRATEADLQWARHLKRHAWLIDLPLVIGNLGLTLIFIGHQNTSEDMLLLQAFVGGASALEMLILSAVHGFAEFAEREAPSPMAIQFRSARV